MKITKAITNCQQVLENGILWDAVLLLSNDKIAGYGTLRETEISEGAEIIDANGKYVGPGFVDLHVHGGGGYSTCYNPVEAAEFFLKHGTTSLLSTPDYHMTLETYYQVIKNIKEAVPKAKTIKGIYMEGPYTNPNHGSHSDTNPWIFGVNEEDYKPLVDELGELALVWTVAPERENIASFIEYAKKVNPKTVIAFGHTIASPAEIVALEKYKPTLLTHAMNATHKYKKDGPGVRCAGVDEYALTNTDMYTELISDSCCIHVNREIQQLMLHYKGYDKVVLITDSTIHNNPNPEWLSHVRDLNFDLKGGIAGSKMTMDQACRNITTHTNCGIAKAFIMASRNPARVIGLDDEIGTITVGKIADLVIVDDKFNVDKAILGGEVQHFE
jgi:N-acetylglucosamine-6-phosphate deacetylase